MRALPPAKPILLEVKHRAIVAHSSFSTPGKCHACRRNKPDPQTLRFFPAKLARSSAPGPCPSLDSSPLLRSVPGAVTFPCAADRLHRLLDHRRSTSARTGQLWSTEARDVRRDAGIRDHRRGHRTLDENAAAAARFRPPCRAHPCRLLTTVPRSRLSCSCSCSPPSAARSRRRWRRRPRRRPAGEQAARKKSAPAAGGFFRAPAARVGVRAAPRVPVCERLGVCVPQVKKRDFVWGLTST